MDEALRIIESLSLVEALRRSIWVYSLVDAGHLLGIALLLGSVAAMDLRVLGFWKDVEFKQLEWCLRPLAIAGLSIAVCCGVLLFSTSAVDYALISLMCWKLALILLGTWQRAVFHRATPSWHRWCSEKHPTYTQHAKTIGIPVLVAVAFGVTRWSPDRVSIGTCSVTGRRNAEHR